MLNKVRDLRTAKGLSQRALAELALTSQQQIQRIESGQSAPRLELAMRIAAALGQGIGTVFPGISLVRRVSASDRARVPTGLRNEFARASGIEIDNSVWTLKILLKGHRAPISLQMEPAAARSLQGDLEAWEDGQGGDEDRAWVFGRSFTEVFAIRVDQVQYWHLRFDPLNEFVYPPPSESAPKVSVYFSGAGERYEFEVDYEYSEDEPGQIASLWADLGTQKLDDADLLTFVDVDGEKVYLRAGGLAVVLVEHEATEFDPSEEA